MLSYNVHVDNDNKIYCIVASTEKEAIQHAIKLYKKDYGTEVTEEDCKVVWNYDEDY